MTLSARPSPVQIFLSSSDTTQLLNGTHKSDLLFLFKSPIIPPPNYNMTLTLKNAYILISFTILNETNNTFILNNATYTIPEGNYTATELASAIMDTIAPVEPAFTIEFSSITNKYTFSDTTDFTVDGTCLFILGLSGASSSTGQELVSTYPVDLTGDNVIYVDIRNLTTFNISSTTANRTSIVGSILVSVPYGSVLYHEDTSKTAFTLQEDHISFIHLRLLGEDQKTLLNLKFEFNSITLEIGFTEKTIQPSVPSTFKDAYKDYITQLTQ